MTSWVVWVVVMAVAGLIGYIATHFSVRTLRYSTLGLAVVLLISVTAYGLSMTAGKSRMDQEAGFATGADRLSAAFFHPVWTLWSVHGTSTPGRLGWVAIGVVLLLGYRFAEACAVLRQAPVLDSSKISDRRPGNGDGDKAAGSAATDAQRADLLAALVKVRLAAVQVRTPPILPGASWSNGLASIAETSGVSGGGLAGATIRLFGLIWPTPRRYELRVWVEGAPQRTVPRGVGAARALMVQAGPARAGMAQEVTLQPGTVRAVTLPAGIAPDAGAAGAMAAIRVTVEIGEAVTGTTVASKTIVAADIEEAAAMAVGYVARLIFAEDPATPQWSYSATDGKDLGMMLLARQDGVLIETADDVYAARRRRLALLWQVTAGDRCAGIVRYESAQLEDLERSHLTALRLHAMNRREHPRFFNGRYSLGMSLGMVANQDLKIITPASTRVLLDETLAALHQCGVTAAARCENGDLYPVDGFSGPSALSHELRAMLLDAARRELRYVRRQLSLPRILWAMLVHRDERTEWKPYLRLQARQGFRDGVCVAELLTAVKQRLNKRDAAMKRLGEPARAMRLASIGGRRTLRAGLKIVTAITGDATAIKTILDRPASDWPGRLLDLPASPVQDRVRWLPWQARTASWQAAYNTAILYAVLAHCGLTAEHQVIVALRRVLGNREPGRDRPYDWLMNDPHIVQLLQSGSPFQETRQFLQMLERREFPLRQISRRVATRGPESW